jgi:polar amino acid transport system permease protein
MSDANQNKPLIIPATRMASPALEALSTRIAKWPWWAIIIMAGLVVTFYSLFTSEIYRQALRSVTENPQLSTNRIASVLYEVRQADGTSSRVSGTLVNDNADSVTVITKDEAHISLSRADIQTLTCSVDTKGEACPLNSEVTFGRQKAKGTLIFESLGSYTLKTIYGDQIIFKIATADAVRTPEGCSADPNGGCEVTLTLKPDHPENTFRGLLISNDPELVTVQTAPPETVTIPKADIVRTINYVPAQCALNNLGACNEGPFLTIWVTLAAFGLSVLFGLAFGLMRVSQNLILFNLSTIYVEVIRGIPLLVILLFVGFAIEPWYHTNFARISPYILVTVVIVAVLATAYQLAKHWRERVTDPAELYQPLSLSIGFGIIGVIFVLSLTERSTVNDTALRSIQAAIVGLAIGYGAFLAELFRAGIQSIGKGQMEAARSLGMTYVQAMRYVILPQAFRVILPPLGNDFIAMLKDTSLIAVLAVPELTQRARLFASATYRPFETYITIAVLYLCMTLFLSLMVRVVERRVNISR